MSDLVAIEADLIEAFADEADTNVPSWIPRRDHFRLQTTRTNDRLDVHQNGVLPNEMNYATIWANGQYEIHWTFPRNYRVIEVLERHGVKVL